MNLTLTGNDDPSDVTIAESSANFFTVTDPGGDLTAGTLCVGGGTTVTCPGVTGAIIAHGSGGDDRITVAPTTTRRALLFGENGNDKLTGGAGADRMQDGLGTDEMRGGDDRDDLQACGPEDDLVMGEGGDDILSTCSGGSKQVIGGPGDDFMSSNIAFGRVDFIGGDGEDTGYLFAQDSGPFKDVTVTLDDQPNDGPAGGTSNWHSDVEDIFTASSADTITGGPGPNTIRSDVYATGYGFNIFGAGNDTIDPGGGNDHVYSGGGNDTIMARDGVADAINCGSNGSSNVSGLPPTDTDTVTADAVDTFVSCETVQASGPADRRAPVMTAKAARSITAKAFRKGLKLHLTADEPASFVAELRAKVKRGRGGLAFAGAVGEMTIGQGRLKLGTGRRTLKLKASKKFAKAVRGKSLRLVVRIVASDAAGNVSSGVRKVRVKRGSR